MALGVAFRSNRFHSTSLALPHRSIAYIILFAVRCAHSVHVVLRGMVGCLSRAVCVCVLFCSVVGEGVGVLYLWFPGGDSVISDQ